MQILSRENLLFDEAGYILYPECKTEEDIQSFKKYYEAAEVLCTFRGNRLNTCRVWFAVKKNVDEIKRENFKNPTRQDEYGTSVLSIQFTKSQSSTLSIKNRYNHTVDNPDATFSNNLDNIIPGLKQSFIDTYEINLNEEELEFCLDNYQCANDGRCYKVILIDDDNCYCENNKIITWLGDILEIDKSKCILAENYIIDLQNCTVKRYGQGDKSDSFIESLGDIEKISVIKDEKDNKIIIFTPKEGENIELTLSKSNSIIGYKNANVKEIGDNFLDLNKTLNNIELPNVETIGNDFLCNNRGLVSLSLPNVERVGKNFVYWNGDITSLSLPKAEEIGRDFLYWNTNLSSISLPNVKKIGSNFLHWNTSLKTLSLPKVEVIGNSFLYRNCLLKELYLPNIKVVGDRFLNFNIALKKFVAPQLTNCPTIYQNLLEQSLNNELEDEGKWLN